MTLLSVPLFQENIEEKIQNAPNEAYEIGVFIGSMLPFVTLVFIAYLFYRYSQKKNQIPCDWLKNIKNRNFKP